PPSGRRLEGHEGSRVGDRRSAGRGGGEGRHLHPWRGQAREPADHPHRPAPHPRPGRARGGCRAGWRAKERDMRTSELGAALALVLAATAPLVAAEVAILKSSDAPGWRPALDALRKAIPTHTFSEYDLRGDRAEAERVLGAMKGRPVILVA